MVEEEETTPLSFVVGDRVVLQGDVTAPEAVTAIPPSAGCNVCGSEENLQTCSACHIVKYCSREHQKEDWKAHKKTCKERTGRRIYYTHMHGTVAVVPTTSSGVVIVDLDLTQDRMKVPVHLLEREAPLPVVEPTDDLDQEHPEHRASVCNGALVESEGRAIDMVLNCMRVITAHLFMGETSIQTPNDVADLKDSTKGILLLNRITSMSWSFWTDGRGFHGTEGKGTYHHMRQYVVEQLYEQGGPEAQNDAPLKRAVKAVDAVNAVKGWNVRVHGCFWVVGMDDEGTFLVSETNRSMVYQCIGVRDAIHPMVERNHPKQIVLMTATMIPWYGRLVYDGVLAPPPGMLYPLVAPPGLAKRLKLQVDLAKQEGRVISRLAQLEVPGGSLLGLHDLATGANDPYGDATAGEEHAEGSTEQEPPTAQEKKLLKQLSKVAMMPGVDTSNPLQAMNNPKPNDYWIFRRMDYTEMENPNHLGLIMSNSSVCIGPFTCSALVPTSVDILTALLEHSKRIRHRPAVIGVDDMKCMERCKFLLEDNVEGTTAFYYAPPTPEESDAAMMGHSW